MAFVRMRLEVMGEVQVSRAFQTFGHEARDMSDPLGRIGDKLLGAVGDQFRTQGARTGAKWVPLNPAYAIWKDAQVGSEPMLVFHQWMRDTLTSKSAITVSSHQLVYRPVGKHDDVAAWHQAGSGHLPQRKLVDLTEIDKRGFERIFADWLNDLRRGPLWTSGPRTRF
jgi:hypothetical protein